MKKVYLTLLTISLLIPLRSFAYTSADILPPLSDVVNEINNTVNSINDKTTGEEIIAKLKKLSLVYTSSVAKINALDATSDSQKATKEKAIRVLTDMQTNLSNAKLAYEAGDDAKYQAAINAHDAGITQLNVVIGDVNTEFSLDTTDYTTLLWALTIIFGLISISLFIASQAGDKNLETAVLQNKLQFQLFLSSLWPTGGSIISLIWYMSTPPGQTYYVLWGPIAIGAFIFLKQYTAYTKEKKELKRKKHSEKKAIIDKDTNERESKKLRIKELVKKLEKHRRLDELDRAELRALTKELDIDLPEMYKEYIGLGQHE